MNKVYEENRIKAIADTIRSKTGTDTTYTTAQMPSGIDEVYAAGKQAGQDAFWDMIQDNGNRTDYNSAFRRWSTEYIRPKYKVVPTSAESGYYTFGYCQNLKKVEADCFDFSKKAKAKNSNSGYYNTFANCYELVEIEDIGLVPQYSYQQTFYYCAKLKTIAKMGVDENTTFGTNTFYNCVELENLSVDGKIGQSGLILKDSAKLSRASIESVINALSDDVEHLSTISNPTVTLSKTAAENAFSVVDCLVGAIYAESQTKDGLTITNNGDGSFTLNGTYNGTDGYSLFFEVATIDYLPIVKSGTYILSLEGDNTNGIQDIYTYGGLNLMQGENTLAEPSGDTIYMNIVIRQGATFDNVTIRPTLVYDEWDSLIYNISHFWTIALV